MFRSWGWGSMAASTNILAAVLASILADYSNIVLPV
jgi:hypothetical protein